MAVKARAETRLQKLLATDKTAQKQWVAYCKAAEVDADDIASLEPEFLREFIADPENYKQKFLVGFLLFVDKQSETYSAKLHWRNNGQSGKGTFEIKGADIIAEMDRIALLEPDPIKKFDLARKYGVDKVREVLASGLEARKFWEKYCSKELGGISDSVSEQDEIVESLVNPMT
eukprot:CAMPEP_0117553698 /NCGR_PEP_ID=MMETSP0784-20121206/50361_1 /TAXON_ID=39447 /ORGANISM="" /LENGTH=173 /DNA_ID=CAMNT_0005350817 /DNA_START=177 /DNA_END=698 /DNA_ORIENTATION=-